MKAIETTYAGYRFRSRLEARWAVFFDVADIPWRYEPEGFELSTGRYLPDFHLPECDTWIEVKGDSRRLDVDQMEVAALELPQDGPETGCENGPALMLLGDIPRPMSTGDYGWVGLSSWGTSGRYGFGTYHKNRRPWWFDDSTEAFFDEPAAEVLTPTVDRYEHNIEGAYTAARQARFEYGQTPVQRRPTLGGVRRTRRPVLDDVDHYLLGIPNPFANVDYSSRGFNR